MLLGWLRRRRWLKANIQRVIVCPRCHGEGEVAGWFDHDGWNYVGCGMCSSVGYVLPTDAEPLR